MIGLTQWTVKSLLRKRSILYIESFVLFMLHLLQIKVHKNKKPVAIESVAFSFSINCTFHTLNK